MTPLVWLFLVVFLPLLFVFLFYKLVTHSFVKLGIPPALVFVLFVLILVGALVNIPVWETHTQDPGGFFKFGAYVFFRPPEVRTVVVAVNVGGALIPLLLSLFLLPKAPFLRTLIAIAVVAAVAHWLARVVPGEGVTVNALIPPLVAAGVAMLVAWRHAAPVAYIAGTLGVLIGADLLNMRQVIQAGGGTFLSIGGAGVFDAVFLVGIIAGFLSPGTESRGSTSMAQH